MIFKDGHSYKVRKLSSSDAYWKDVQNAIMTRRKDTSKSLVLQELYSVEWNAKPFPWSWTKEFRPNRRFFYHGTPIPTIQKILNEGFKIGNMQSARSGRMLGDGVYATYHTDKALNYAPEGYVISAMVYTPRILLINPTSLIDLNSIANAPSKYNAIEVRTGAIVNNYTMQKHEICVFNTQRIIPRFISKIIVK